MHFIKHMLALAEQFHGTVLVQVDDTHRVVQLARDEEMCFILPVHLLEGVWTSYDDASGLPIFWQRKSSGYYQQSNALDFLATGHIALPTGRHVQDTAIVIIAIDGGYRVEGTRASDASRYSLNMCIMHGLPTYIERDEHDWFLGLVSGRLNLWLETRDDDDAVSPRQRQFIG